MGALGDHRSTDGVPLLDHVVHRKFRCGDGTRYPVLMK
jgi:hypothetical protein